MKIIDLTYLVKNNMTVYPNSDKPCFLKVANIKNDGYNESKLNLLSHTGTHIDAPYHIFENGKKLTDFHISKFIGKSILVHCHDVDQKICISSIDNIIDELNDIDYIIFNTGHGKYFNTDKYFSNSTFLSKKLAKLLTQYNIKGVGIDSISIDSLYPFSLDVHKILLEKDILIIENLANLNDIPKSKFDFFALPLYFENSGGAPVRAIAKLL